MQLLGRATSVNVQKVLWALEELKLPYDRKDMGGAFGGLDTAEYGTLNPTRKVPTLRDGDLVLWESSAIVRYLARNYGGGRLAGATPEIAAKADMWMEWYQNNAYAHATAVFHQTVRLPRADRDPAVRDRALDALTAQFAIAEAQLAQTPYLAGDQLTVADIPFGSSLHRYFTMDIDRPTLPALAAYFERLGQSEAYRSTVTTSYESLRAADG